MSKLAHSDAETMDLIDIRRAVANGDEDLLPKHIGLPLLALEAIALADGKLPGHSYYLTKYQMIRIAKNTRAALALPGDGS